MKINELDEGIGQFRGIRRDAYQRDYDSSVSGFGNRRREIDDEANLMYIYRDGRVKQRMISNHEERSAHREGFRQTPEDALRLHGIIRSKFDPKKWVQKQGSQWIQVHPFGKPEGVAESATVGGTSSANIATVENSKVAYSKKTSQPKKKDGTAVNALDMKGVSLFGGPAVKR
jgi:hypothetical protein